LIKDLSLQEELNEYARSFSGFKAPLINIPHNCKLVCRGIIKETLGESF
jgi:hypothetical protein